MSSSGDSGPGTREVAYRLFAAEFDDCSLSYAESDDERAPNYVVTPTGLRVNRLFAVGVLTETEAVNDETLRGRIVDPTGAFVTYAGQYQPGAQAFLDRTTPPAFVAITGKARTFEPEDSDRVFTSVRPESLSEVEASTRDRWVVSAAESTLRRIAICVAALESPLSGEALGRALADAGIDDSLAAGIPRAIEHYGTTTAYLDALRQLAVDALEVVADEREEVRSFDVAPDVDGEASVGPLPPVDVDLSPLATDPQPTDSEPTADATTQTEEPTDTASDDAEPADSSEPATSVSTDSMKTADTADTEPSAEAVDESTPGGETDTVAEDTGTAAEETAAVAGDVDTASEDAETAPENAASAAESPTEARVSTSESTTEPESEPPADEPAEDGMYQLDDDERAELESEYDTGFSSGNDVDPAGEAGIDVPDVDELAAQAEQAEETVSASTAEANDSLGSFEDEVAESTAETSPPEEPTETPDSADEASVDSTESAEPDTAAEESTETDPDESVDAAVDIDLEETVIEVMAELDDGNGVDRAGLVAEVIDRHGVGEDEIQEAIADALMGGRCYEPGDDTLKAI